MQEYTVIKKGSSIHHCIKIRPLKDAGKISIKLKSLFKKYPGIKPFVDIKDPKKWQQELRDEWK